MANEIFYSALGGAIGGGSVVFIWSVLPRTFGFFWHGYIRFRYRKNIKSLVSNWGDGGMVLLPNGREIYSEYGDAQKVRLLKECIIHQDWPFFRRSLLLFNEIDTISHQKFEERREKEK